MPTPCRTSGFTIIELVCALVILSVLASVALPRFIDVSGEAHDALVLRVVDDMQAAHAQLVALWTLSGRPGAGSTTQVNIDAGGIVVRFRDGNPNTTTNAAHVPVDTPDRTAAQTRLFFLFLATPPQPVIAADSTGTGWVMLGTNAACAPPAAVGPNPRRCWEYRVNGARHARISYSTTAGRFLID